MLHSFTTTYIRDALIKVVKNTDARLLHKTSSTLPMLSSLYSKIMKFLISKILHGLQMLSVSFKSTDHWKVNNSCVPRFFENILRNYSSDSIGNAWNWRLWIIRNSLEFLLNFECSKIMKVFVVGSGNYESLCCEILCFRYTATVVHGWLC